MHRHTVAACLIALWPTAYAVPAESPDAVMARIDKAGKMFHGMTAHVRRVSHTEVINDDNIDSGEMRLKRARPKDMQMLIELTQPDPKFVAFQGRKLEVYYPKMQTVQEFDVGRNRELLDQFFLIGFGTSSADLESSYRIGLLGSETVEGQKAERLELIPKSKDLAAHLKKFELWITADGYPVQQKFYLPGGDFMLVTYSNMKINPSLPDSDLKLHLPRNVKREYPQK